MPYTPNTTWVDGSGGGTPISAARLNNIEAGLPYELGTTAFTANVTISATTEGTANTIVTAPAITFDGSTVALIEFYAPDLQSGANAAGNTCIVVLYLDGALIGQWGYQGTSLNGTMDGSAYMMRRLTPASGSRTYSVRAYRTNANCTVVAGAGGSGAVTPGFIRVTRSV